MNALDQYLIDVGRYGDLPPVSSIHRHPVFVVDSADRQRRADFSTQ